MNYLTELAANYNRHADRIVKKHTTEEGEFDASFQPHVDFYRDAAANVARLNEGLEESGEMILNLESDRAGAAFNTKKVSTRDKAATPQELIQKASA